MRAPEVPREIHTAFGGETSRTMTSLLKIDKIGWVHWVHWVHLAISDFWKRDDVREAAKHIRKNSAAVPRRSSSAGCGPPVSLGQGVMGTGWRLRNNAGNLEPKWMNRGSEHLGCFYLFLCCKREHWGNIEETQETHGHVSMHWIEWLFARQKSRNSQQRIGM